jgi:hypothetical protein
MAHEALTKLVINGHEFLFDPSLGIQSQVLHGFSVEAVECVIDYLYAKRQCQHQFHVKPNLALEVLKLANHLNIK